MDLGEAMIARAKAEARRRGDLRRPRIHWVERPQGEALPALVLQVDQRHRPEDLDGEEMRTTARVQARQLRRSKQGRRPTPTRARGGDRRAAARGRGPRRRRRNRLLARPRRGPRDLGEQTDTGFVHRASADLIIRIRESLTEKET
jgi:hypothetical protein